MSHLFETGMFVGQPAWHGLGVVLQNSPSIGEALTLAGLDWTVESIPAQYQDGVDAFGLPRMLTVPDTNVMVRSTDRQVFGTMGRLYRPLQNVEALGRFQPMVESGHVRLVAAGSLDTGRKIWILGEINGATGDVVKGDAVKAYVLLAHSHDGSLTIKFGHTKTRVVCNNTLQVALSDDGAKMYSRKHTKNAIVDLDKVVANIDFARADLQADIEKFKFLARKKCDDKNMKRFARALLGGESKTDTDEPVRYIDEVATKFETGIGTDIPGVRGTMWGAFNAATEFLTHDIGRGADTRVTSGWFGKNAQTTERALSLALQFAESAPDAASLGRECYANNATAAAEFGALLGGSYIPAEQAAE